MAAKLTLRLRGNSRILLATQHLAATGAKLVEVAKKRLEKDLKGQAPEESAAQGIPSNAQQAPIAAVGAVYLRTKASADDLSGEGQEPDVEKANSEGQAGQAQEMA